MIAKNSKGYGFRGVLDYALGKGRIIGGNMSGKTTPVLTTEFRAIQKLRPKLQKSVYHAALSTPQDESLDDGTWAKIAAQFMDDMGYAESQYVVIRHEDRDHEHIHVIANRVTMTGDAVSDSHDYRRQEQSMRRVELDFGLSVTVGSEQVGKKALTKGELEKEKRTQEACPRRYIRETIDNILTTPCTTVEFAQQLKLAGVGVRANIASTGKMNGFSFQYDGIAFSGSKLGKAYGWKALQQRGVNYNAARDSDLIYLSKLQEEKSHEKIRHPKQGIRRDDEVNRETLEGSTMVPPVEQTISKEDISFFEQSDKDSPEAPNADHETSESVLLACQNHQATDIADGEISRPKEISPKTQNPEEDQYEKENRRRITRADRLIERAARASAGTRTAIARTSRFIDGAYAQIERLYERIRDGGRWLEAARRQLAKRISVRRACRRPRPVVQPTNGPANSDQEGYSTSGPSYIGPAIDGSGSDDSSYTPSGPPKKIRRKTRDLTGNTGRPKNQESPPPPPSGLTKEMRRQIAVHIHIDDVWEWLNAQTWRTEQIQQGQQLIIRYHHKKASRDIDSEGEYFTSADSGEDEDEGVKL